MQTVASRGLGCLDEIALQVVKGFLPKLALPLKPWPGFIFLEAKRTPWNLHKGAVRHRRSTEEGGNSDDALPAYDRNFDSSPILQRGDNRHQAAFHEIQLPDRF